MRFAHRVFSTALIGAVVSWLPLAASAAWNAEDGGPHREHRVEAPPAGPPQETRSMAPKAGVAITREVGPHAAEPPAGVHSMAPKAGVAFTRPIGRPGEEPDTGLASD